MKFKGSEVFKIATKNIRKIYVHGDISVTLVLRLCVGNRFPIREGILLFAVSSRPALRLTQTHTRMYPKVFGLDAWSENCKWYSSLPLSAVVSLFYESV
jgi:hypothetical protein